MSIPLNSSFHLNIQLNMQQGSVLVDALKDYEQKLETELARAKKLGHSLVIINAEDGLNRVDEIMEMLGRTRIRPISNKTKNRIINI